MSFLIALLLFIVVLMCVVTCTLQFICISLHRGTLHCALSLFAGHVELVKLLLSKGVDVDLQSEAGTPLMWAAGFGQEEVVKVLLEHHANVSALLPI